MDGLHHLTLDTGALRWSPRAEVADDVIAIAAAHIAAARRRGPSPIPGQDGYDARAMASKGVLALTARHRGTPIMGLVVAPTRAVAVAAEWALDPARADLVPSLTPADAPVCLAWLLPGLIAVPEAAHWLGDYERCVAWAWLRGRA